MVHSLNQLMKMLGGGEIGVEESLDFFYYYFTSFCDMILRYKMDEMKWKKSQSVNKFLNF